MQVGKLGKWTPILVLHGVLGIDSVGAMYRVAIECLGLVLTWSMYREWR